MFTVIDPRTGREPTRDELNAIIRNEKWAEWLAPGKAQELLIGSDGIVYLIDKCSDYAECPPGRFGVRWT